MMIAGEPQIMQILWDDDCNSLRIGPQKGEGLAVLISGAPMVAPKAAHQWQEYECSKNLAKCFSTPRSATNDANDLSDRLSVIADDYQ